MSDFSKFEGESSKTIKLNVDEHKYENIRLDKFIADNVDVLSRSKIVELIDDKSMFSAFKKCK